MDPVFSGDQVRHDDQKIGDFLNYDTFSCAGMTRVAMAIRGLGQFDVIAMEYIEGAEYKIAIRGGAG